MHAGVGLSGRGRPRLFAQPERQAVHPVASKAAAGATGATIPDRPAHGDGPHRQDVGIRP